MMIIMMMSMNLTTMVLRFKIITARTQIPMLKQVRKPVKDLWWLCSKSKETRYERLAVNNVDITDV